LEKTREKNWQNNGRIELEEGWSFISSAFSDTTLIEKGALKKKNEFKGNFEEEREKRRLPLDVLEICSFYRPSMRKKSLKRRKR